MSSFPVRIRPMAVVVTAFVGVLVAVTVLPTQVPDMSGSAYLAGGIAAGLTLLLLLAVGQLATAAAARRSGLTVERLDVGLLAEPAVRGEPATAGALARTAAVGPLASAAVALAVVGGSVALEQAAGHSISVAVLRWAGQTTLALTVVSLLPVVPLPGHRLLTALLWWRRGDQLAGRAGTARVAKLLGGTLVAAGAPLTLLFGPVGVVPALAGWFVLTSARLDQRAVTARTVLAELQVHDVMADPPDVLPGWLSVAAAADRLPAMPRHAVIAVRGFDGHVHGLVPLSAITAVPAGMRPTLKLERLALPATAVRFVHADDLATVLVDPLPPNATPGLALVVGGDGQPVGLVAPDDIDRAIQLSPLRRHSPAERHEP